MKYDSSMTHFHKDIIAALRYMLKDDSEITEKFSPKDGSPAPLREYLKNKYGKSCMSHIGDGMRYSCKAASGLELTFGIILNNPGDKNLTLSWSQTAKFIRDNWDEVFKKSEVAEQPSPQISYIDKLRERYPKINETDKWVWGFYCPSSLFLGENISDTLNSLCDRNENGCKECWNSRCETDVTFDNTELDVFEDNYFEHYPEEKADEQPVAEDVSEEKITAKTGSEGELTHLCNKFGKDPCEFFLQTNNEKTVLSGKTLDICSYYCTSENKIRKIGSGGTWTGLSPKFCPKRRAAENGSAPESKPTYKDIFLEHYPNFDVSRFDEFAESLCVACCFDDGGAACPFPGSDECKTHWESECLFEWRDKTDEYALETIKEFFIEQPSESKTEESTAETENQLIPQNAGEISETFNYAVLSSELGDFLKRKEQQLKNEYMNFTANCGAIFAEVQEKLAKDGHGTFIKWIEAMGFKKDTVYRMIDVNKFRLSLIAKDENGTQEIFDALPKYLQYDISKPSAPAELVEQVLNGDITTHKDYVALKKQLDEARSETENVKRDNEKNSAKLAAETAKADELKRNIEELNEKNTRLALEIVKLEKRPVDVIVDSNEVNKRVAEAVSKINSETEQTLAAREQEFAETLHFKDERIWALEDKLKELGGGTDVDKKIYLLSMTDEDYRKMLTEVNGSSFRNILEAAAVVDIK